MTECQNKGASTVLDVQKMQNKHRHINSDTLGSKIIYPVDASVRDFSPRGKDLHDFEVLNPD